MTAYIFRTSTGIVLAPVLADNESEAYALLEKEHEWCGANKHNCTLIRQVSIEEPLGFDALLPSY